MLKFSLQKKLQAVTGPMQVDIDLEIEERKLVCLYGKSGAGKTSILRMLAGLMQTDSGRIEIHNKIWLDTQNNISVRPQQRKVGFLFQDYALFPNMTVQENLAFALQKGQPSNIISEILMMMELGTLHSRKPATLSGGQQQRVALARALVQRPDLLLLDEPLSALDYEMRNKLQDYILKIHQVYGLTTILVSHEPSEILKLANEVIHIDQGKVIQRTNPSSFFNADKLNIKGLILKKDTIQNRIFVQLGTNKVWLSVSKKQIESLQIGGQTNLAFD